MTTFYRAEQLDADIAALYADLGLTPADYRTIMDEIRPYVNPSLQNMPEVKISAAKQIKAAKGKTRQQQRLTKKAAGKAKRDPFAEWLAQTHPDHITTTQAAFMLKTTTNRVTMMMRAGRLRGRVITPWEWLGLERGRNRAAVMLADVVAAQEGKTIQ
jgi:hypothetical protein